MEILCYKRAGVLIPATEEEAEKLAKIKTGQVLRMDMVKMRNGAFFRKFWALAKFAYDIWSETVQPQTYKGQPVRATFDRFRKDLTVLAGYYEATYNVRGEVRLEAKSLAWGKMSEDEFERFFSDVIQTVLSKVLNNVKLTEKEVREHVERALQFDS
jgi:hypothetical protein